MLKIKSHFHLFHSWTIFLVKLFVFPELLLFLFYFYSVDSSSLFFAIILISYGWLIKSVQKIHILLEDFLLLSDFYAVIQTVLSKHATTLGFFSLYFLRVRSIFFQMMFFFLSFKFPASSPRKCSQTSISLESFIPESSKRIFILPFHWLIA